MVRLPQYPSDRHGASFHFVGRRFKRFLDATGESATVRGAKLTWKSRGFVERGTTCATAVRVGQAFRGAEVGLPVQLVLAGDFPRNRGGKNHDYHPHPHQALEAVVRLIDED